MTVRRRWRGWCCSCLFLLSLVWTAYAQDAQQVRVMTYNIHHGATAKEVPSLPRIAELIRELDVDVVALQEVDRHWSERSAFADQTTELAEQLKMEVAFGPIYDLPLEEKGRQRRQYGLAILSRYPIVSSRNFELTRLTTVTSEPERKLLPGFPMVTIDIGGTSLHVFNTHLDYRADPKIRRQQVAEMLEIIARYDPPMILVGDFNALPDAEELRPLYEVFTDAWEEAGEGDGFTYPAEQPVKRIDAIFVSPGFVVDSVFVPNSTASDHRSVAADLLLVP